MDSNRLAGELRTIASTVASGGSLARWREAMGPQDVIVLIDGCGNMQIFVGIDADDDGIRLLRTLLHG